VIYFLIHESLHALKISQYLRFLKRFLLTSDCVVFVGGPHGSDTWFRFVFFFYYIIVLGDIVTFTKFSYAS
jgi:hypothetical protein